MAFLFSWRQFTTSLSVCWGLHVQNIERRWKMSSRFLLLSDLIKRHVQVLLYWLGGLWEKQNTCQVNYSASVQSNQCTVQHGYNEKAYNEITQPSQFYSPILIMYYKLIRCDKFLFWYSILFNWCSCNETKETAHKFNASLSPEFFSIIG